MIIQSEKYPCVDLAAVTSRLTPEDQEEVPTETEEGSKEEESTSALKEKETEGLTGAKSTKQEDGNQDLK